jgi:membrane protein required for beta-lactamase induction
LDTHGSSAADVHRKSFFLLVPRKANLLGVLSTLFQLEEFEERHHVSVNEMKDLRRVVDEEHVVVLVVLALVIVTVTIEIRLRVEEMLPD